MSQCRIRHYADTTHIGLSGIGKIGDSGIAPFLKPR